MTSADTTDQTRTLLLPDESAQLAYAANVASNIQDAFVIFLKGDLGTGKTTFARGFIQAILEAGDDSVIKSPTYTLVEPYPVKGGRMCYHFDLYRLADPEELEFTGARDYFNEQDICLVEWPEKAEGYLPVADWICQLAYHEQGRKLKVTACTEKGNNLMLRIFPDERL
jgi:tRNA threonylcarbamoyladenosine biosynthesis protein TsaE